MSTIIIKIYLFIYLLIFSPNDSPSKTIKKCFLFHLKSSFCSQDIQFFVFLSFPIFLLVGHCFRAWLKINLNVHDIINSLNKSSIIHFVWYLDKEKRYDIETLSIYGASDKECFYKKIRQKMCSKATPKPLYNFGKQPKTAIACTKLL